MALQTFPFGISLLALSAGFLPGCGQVDDLPDNSHDSSNEVVRSLIGLEVSDEDGDPAADLESASADPLKVQFKIDRSRFKAPKITPDWMSFGTLTVTELKDNDLDVCGDRRKTKCKFAKIRLYTRGAQGAGLWNTRDRYGAPLAASVTGGPRLLVGLGALQSATISTYAIPANKKSLELSDFKPVPKFLIESDFRNAGTGRFATTLVIEYLLTL